MTSEFGAVNWHIQFGNLVSAYPNLQNLELKSDQEIDSDISGCPDCAQFSGGKRQYNLAQLTRKCAAVEGEQLHQRFESGAS